MMTTSEFADEDRPRYALPAARRKAFTRHCIGATFRDVVLLLTLTSACSNAIRETAAGPIGARAIAPTEPQPSGEVSEPIARADSLIDWLARSPEVLHFSVTAYPSASGPLLRIANTEYADRTDVCFLRTPETESASLQCGSGPPGASLFARRFSEAAFAADEPNVMFAVAQETGVEAAIVEVRLLEMRRRTVGRLEFSATPPTLLPNTHGAIRYERAQPEEASAWTTLASIAEPPEWAQMILRDRYDVTHRVSSPQGLDVFVVVHHGDSQLAWRTNHGGWRFLPFDALGLHHDVFVHEVLDAAPLTGVGDSWLVFAHTSSPGQDESELDAYWVLLVEVEEQLEARGSLHLSQETTSHYEWRSGHGGRRDVRAYYEPHVISLGCVELRPLRGNTRGARMLQWWRYQSTDGFVRSSDRCVE